jgi:type IV pilus assembly protein PilB
MKNLRIGDMLVDEGYITEDQLKEALEAQKQDRSKKIGEHLVDLGFVSEEQIAAVLSQKLGYPLISLETTEIDVDAVAQIPEELARKYNMIAFKESEDGTDLSVATSDPLNYYGIEDIHMVTNKHLTINIALKQDVNNAIDYNYSEINSRNAAESINNNADMYELSDEDLFDADEDDSPVVKLINSLLIRGYRDKVSDIHIEPFKEETTVRMRIDGVLVDTMKLKASIHPPLVVRVKIMAGMDISDRRLPQDGHIVTVINGQEINLRVSTIPTIHGEKIVLRYLNTNAQIDHSDTFGMTKTNYEKMKHMMEMPNGIIYVTGPTGSGKTTTLYMVMKSLAKRPVNITTIEDPVEEQLDRVNQMQVNVQAGMTFEKGLRAILRQDPDIIMVGETRDNETANISVRSAITGHLVVSTLHTNDSLATIVRLEDMGVEPYMVASSLVGVVAQRLVRKVCPYCGKLVKPTMQDEAMLTKKIELVPKAVGCSMCNHTGYMGRIAIHEIVTIDRHLKRMIADTKPLDEIKAYAKKTQGYKTLFEETQDLVEQGTTTIDELRRISYYEE